MCSHHNRSQGRKNFFRKVLSDTCVHLGIVRDCGNLPQHPSPSRSGRVISVQIAHGYLGVAIGHLARPIPKSCKLWEISMTTMTECPSAERLHAYCLGQLSEEGERRSVRAHSKLRNVQVRAGNDWR